jgi:hypothetical protein
MRRASTRFYGSLEPGLAADESFNFLLQHFGWQSRDVPPRMLVGDSGLFTSGFGPDEPDRCPSSAGFGRVAYGKKGRHCLPFAVAFCLTN